MKTTTIKYHKPAEIRSDDVWKPVLTDIISRGYVIIGSGCSELKRAANRPTESPAASISLKKLVKF